MNRFENVKIQLWPILFFILVSCQEKQHISLHGTWRFAMDTADVGIRDQWFQQKLDEHIILPGSMAENNKGFEVSLETQWTGQIIDRSWYTDEKYAPYRQPGNIKIPFWLTPVKHFVGPAWYQKEIIIPKNWAHHPLELFLERTHWETMAWLDANYLGTKNSLTTPNIFQIQDIKPGKHVLTLRVDNRVNIDVGMNAHSVSDHTQTNWNGLIGKLELRKRPSCEIIHVDVFPDMKNHSALIRFDIFNHTGETAMTTLTTHATASYAGKTHSPGYMEVSATVNPGLTTLESTYDLGHEMMTWDEFNPAVYRLTSHIGAGPDRDEYTTVFGMREFKVEGTQFGLNGQNIFLRGTLECAIFPYTGYPPTDVESWKANFQVAKNYGLNHIRFHSWCPPEAAFQAADELGIYLQVECGAWATIGNGEPIDAFVMEESKRIVNEYGNHPSFCLLAYGNEPGGPNQGTYLTEFLEFWKQKDPRRVYTGAAGWPALQANDYHNLPEPRGHLWGAGLSSRFNTTPINREYDYSPIIQRFEKPVVSHEIGQWCAFPDMEEIAEYTGVLKARNFEIVRDQLEQNGMIHQAHDFLMASGKWQALLYKEEIETALRTPGFAGFQLLDLHDFPGQGTALVGVLNPFWKSKGYITGPEFIAFCNDMVPMTRISTVVYDQYDTMDIPIVIAHYGREDITSDILVSLQYPDGTVYFEDIFKNVMLSSGDITELPNVRIGLTQVQVPAHLQLVISISGPDHTNTWDVWVYSHYHEKHPPHDIVVTTSWDTAHAALQKGHKVLLNIPPGQVNSNVPPGFSTIFWNTAWTRKQKPHTLGLLCDPEHPAFNDFPTQFHTNWQWFDVISHSKPMVMDHLPGKLFPIIQIIDDWNTNRKLGLVFEGTCSTGKLMVSTIDFNTPSKQKMVRDQLLISVLNYMVSDFFDPENEIPESAVQDLIKPFNIMNQATIVNHPPDVPGYEAKYAIDQDPETFWHSPWSGVIPPHPHELDLDLGVITRVTGFRFLPRQDGNTGGMISKCAVYGSTDGQNWNTPLAMATFARDAYPKEIRLDHLSPIRYVKFVALKGFEDQTFSSLAELEVLTEK